MKIIKSLSLTLFLALIVFASDSIAQDNSVTVTASGTVLQPLDVTGTNLTFSDEIFPGIDEAVAHTEAGAAQFDITGEDGREINVEFTLPTELDGAGETTLPISFDTDDAGSNEDDVQGSAVAFDPNSSETLNLSATGTLFIWLGGTVEPASDQAAGAYSGEITLDLTYTGI